MKGCLLWQKSLKDPANEDNMPFNPANKVSDAILRENIERNIELIAVQQRHAQEVLPPEKSGYYKSAIILAASVTEALVFELVKKHSTKYNLPVSVNVDYKQRQQLSEKIKYKNTGNALVICEKRMQQKFIDDNVTFIELNRYCKRHKLVTESEFNKLEYVRKIRNRIHIQSLEESDTGHTKKKLEKVSSAMNVIDAKLGSL